MTELTLEELAVTELQAELLPGEYAGGAERVSHERAKDAAHSMLLIHDGIQGDYDTLRHYISQQEQSGREMMALADELNTAKEDLVRERISHGATLTERDAAETNFAKSCRSLSEAQTKLATAEQEARENAEGYHSLLKDYMADKYRHRETEAKLAEAELLIGAQRTDLSALRRQRAAQRNSEAEKETAMADDIKAVTHAQARACLVSVPGKIEHGTLWRYIDQQLLQQETAERDTENLRTQAALWLSATGAAIKERDEVRGKLVHAIALAGNWRATIEGALGVESDDSEHTPQWAYERVLAIREIGNGVRSESGPAEPATTEAPAPGCATPGCVYKGGHLGKCFEVGSAEYWHSRFSTCLSMLEGTQAELTETQEKLANSRALSEALGEEWRKAGVLSERDALKKQLQAQAEELAALRELEHLARTDDAVRRFVAPALAKLDALRKRRAEAAPVAKEWRCPQCNDTLSGTGCIACAYKRQAKAEAPSEPAGWVPKAGDRVVVIDFGPQHGKEFPVHAIGGAGAVRVKLDNGDTLSLLPSDVAPAEPAPQPPATTGGAAGTPIDHQGPINESKDSPAGERGDFRVGQRRTVTAEPSARYLETGVVERVGGGEQEGWLGMRFPSTTFSLVQAAHTEPADPAQPQPQGDGVTRAELCRLFRGVNIRAFDEIADRLERRPP